MTTTIKGLGAASAAALFALSSLASAAPAPAGSTGPAVAASDTVHCYGVNSCKGTADCKTHGNKGGGQQRQTGGWAGGHEIKAECGSP